MPEAPPVPAEPAAPAKRQPAPRKPAPVPQPVRFSGPNLIGDTGLTPPPGARLIVANSRHNDGAYEVLSSDAEWIAVRPYVQDEAPTSAIISVEPSA